MKTLILTILLMIAFNAAGGAPEFQSTDPTKPFYLPPPEPKEEVFDDLTIITSWEVYLAHPDAQFMAPDLPANVRERIQNHRRDKFVKAMERLALAQENWKPKKALDDIAGKDTPKKLKIQAVGVVKWARAQILASGENEALIQYHVTAALDKLHKLLPDADPKKLGKLLTTKPEDLYEE